MTAARPAPPFAALPAAVGALAGCDPGEFRAETELRPDGSVSRTVLQREIGEGWSDGWTAVRPADPPDGFDWADPLAEAPGLPPYGPGEAIADAQNPVLASGTFPSAADLPDHLQLDGFGLGERGLPTTGLTRDVTVTDFGVLTLYDWTETVTPGTDPVRMERARREAVELWAWFAPAAIEAALPDADASRLAGWVRTTGADATADAQAAFFAAKAAGAGDFASLYRRVAPLAGEYGLDLPADPPRFDREGSVAEVDGEAAARPVPPHVAAARAFAGEVVAAHVVSTRDGTDRPLNDEELDLAVSVLFRGGSRGESLPRGAEAAVRRTLRARFGSDEAGRDAMSRPVAAWLGAGGLNGLFGVPFAYRHRTPGLLLETNGVILSPGGDDQPAEVLFRFTLADSHPFGRPMTARSVVLHADRQRDLLGEAPIADRTAAVRFLDRMADPEARAVWDAAVAAGDGAALRGLLPGS